jgi:hypothetical protein
VCAISPSMPRTTSSASDYSDCLGTSARPVPESAGTPCPTGCICQLRQERATASESA